MNKISRFIPKINESFFLFGPRGTGKSTWLQQHYAKSLYIDFLSPATYREFLSKPERLADLVAGNPDKRIVVIDEVQKVPQILSVVHQLIERDKELQFILTGSSARKLKRAGTDLLAGRALLKTAHPFMAAELGDAFSLDEALQYGMLPLVLDSDNPGAVLSSYAALYLREEVQMEGLVRNTGDFSRFLESISFSHGSILNTTDVAREAEVSRKTVEGYIGILEDLLLCFQVPVFTRRANRRMTAHPKFYYFDAGVFASLRPAGPLDRPSEIGGAALEGLVGQHLRAWLAYSGDRDRLYFWRTVSGTEVDFVLYGESGIRAIEIKNTARINPKDLRGLKAFKKDYPAAETLLLYRGTEKIMIRDILCMPCERFLKSLAPGKPFSHAISE